MAAEGRLAGGWALPALIALTGLAAAIRFATLDTQSLWLDEAVTAQLVQLPLGEMLSEIPGSESTPPLYYLLAWGWERLFGAGEAGLRSLPALLGTAFVPVAYAAAAQLATRRAGLAVAGLAAVNPLLVHYSQEARSYALLVLLGGLALLCFARALVVPTGNRVDVWRAKIKSDEDEGAVDAGSHRRARGQSQTQICSRQTRPYLREGPLTRPAPGALAGWAAASVLAIATHYYALFLIAPTGLWLLLATRGRDRRNAALAVAAPAAAALALAPLALHQRGLDLASFIRDTSLVERLVRLPKQFLVGFQGPAEPVLAVAALAVAAVGVWLVLSYGEGRERRGARIGAVVGGAAVGLPFALAIAGIDHFDTRNAIAAWLPLAVVLGAGFGAARAGALGIVGAVALAAVFAIVTIGVAAEPAHQRQDWRGAAEALGPPPPGGRALVVTPNHALTPLGYYLPGLEPFPEPGPPVSEVAYLGLPAIAARLGQGGEPPRPPGVAAPGPTFREARRDYAKTYSLVVFRSHDPAPVIAPALAAARLDPAHEAIVLFQPPRRQ